MTNETARNLAIQFRRAAELLDCFQEPDQTGLGIDRIIAQNIEPVWGVRIIPVDQYNLVIKSLDEAKP